MRLHALRTRLLLVAIGLTLASAPAWADACKLKRVTSLPMTVGGSNQLLVPATFNGGKEGRVVVDTGAGASLIRASVSDALGLTERQLRGGLYGLGGGALTKGVLVDLKLGQLVARQAVLVIAPDQAFRHDASIAGLIGRDYLMSYDLDLDFGGAKVNLFSKDHCPEQVVYWAKSAIKIPISLSDGNQIILPVTLDGKKLRALLDTGASTTVLGLPIASEKFDLDEHSPGVEAFGTIATADGANLQAYQYRFHTLEIGGIAYHDVPINLIPTPSIGQPQTGTRVNTLQAGRPELILGIRELSKLHIYIAVDERALYVTPAGEGL
jgi:hypothetical protein